MPKALYADLGINRPGSKVVEYFDLKLFYESSRVILKSSYFVREALPGYVLHGSKGSFIKAKTDVQENDLLAGKLPGTANWGIEPEQERGFLHTEKDGKIIRELVPSLRGNYMDYYDSLYEAIRNDKTVPVTGTEGMRVIKLIEAAILSNELRKVIDL
jgi:predicted dehydrogenase